MTTACTGYWLRQVSVDQVRHGILELLGKHIKLGGATAGCSYADAVQE